MFSDKQLAVLSAPPCRHVLLHGSVRSGKTYISLILLITVAICQRHLHRVKEKVRPNIAVIAQTRATFTRNILELIKNMIGSKHVNMKGFSINNTFHVFGIRFEFISARSADLVRRVKGGTFSTIYIDELTLLNSSSYNLILTRAVSAGIRIISTTNPDHPGHFVKKHIIDKEKESNGTIKSFHFLLEDNPFLNNEEIEEFKKSIRDKLTYQRYVEGLWVSAEGAIYRIDNDIHVIKYIPFNPASYMLGVDYGTNNPFACVLLSCSAGNSLPSMVISDELFYDPKEQVGGKSPSDYALMIEAKFGKYKPMMDLYVDPSATALILELRRMGYRIFPSNNDVYQGIQTVSNFLWNGELVILDQCHNVIREIHSYRWDEAHGDRTGHDKPIKKDDHLMDALRYCIHSRFAHIGTYGKASRGDSVKPDYGIKKGHHEDYIKNVMNSPQNIPSIAEAYTPII